MQALIIDIVVGYMIKVLKSGTPIVAFRNEFAAIRHGNYYDFINFVGEPIPFMITYNNGVIQEEIEARKDDIDFQGLLKAGPSLKKFYIDCKKMYGEIKDIELTDETYRKLVHFEIMLRMHANNHKLLTGKEKLINVISKLAAFKNFTNKEIELLQKGRDFLNKVKHGSKSPISWINETIIFDKAFQVLENHKLTF